MTEDNWGRWTNVSIFYISVGVHSGHVKSICNLTDYGDDDEEIHCCYHCAESEILPSDEETVMSGSDDSEYLTALEEEVAAEVGTIKSSITSSWLWSAAVPSPNYSIDFEGQLFPPSGRKNLHETTVDSPPLTIRLVASPVQAHLINFFKKNPSAASVFIGHNTLLPVWCSQN